ncbi:MAG: dipeptidase PepV, partial [Clostridiales bacterium]|nr:dipeptidase PepV [Clostridiales bacterium]
MEKVLEQLLEQYREEMIEDLCAVLKFETLTEEGTQGAPFGRTMNDCLNFVLKRAEEMGFACENLDGYVGIIDSGEGEESVGVLTHIDVVPAGEGWILPPYGGQISEDGVIFGRGTVDDKGPMIAALYACRAIKESGLPTKRSFRQIVGTDEETAFRCMKYYLKHYPQPTMGFSPDAQFPLIYIEKGIGHWEALGCFDAAKEGDIVLTALDGGSVRNMVPDGAKATFLVTETGCDVIYEKLEKFTSKDKLIIEKCEDGQLILAAKGEAAHASTPEKGDNAVATLLRFLQTLTYAPLDACTTLNKLAELVAYDFLGQGMGVAHKEQESGELTLVGSVIKFDGENFSLGVDTRYPIDIPTEQLKADLAAKMESIGLTFSPFDFKDSLYVPRDSYLVQTLLETYQDFTGDMKSQPLAIGGGTYARAMKNFVAFGPGMPDEEELIHKPNEQISC